MTSDVQGSASGAMAGRVAGEAALVATFYGPSGDERTDWLYKSLDQSLPGPPETLLERFRPPGGAARDTVAIQLALNAPGEEATKGWKEARQKLEGSL